MTNKYAEGYPGKRYYGAASMSISPRNSRSSAPRSSSASTSPTFSEFGLADEPGGLPGAAAAGATPHGLDLNSGGHLTHGSPVNMSGKWFNVVSYGVRQDDHLLDMDEVAKKAREQKPKADHRRRNGLFPHLGLEALPRDRRRGGRVADGRHGRTLPVSWPVASIRRRSRIGHVATTTRHKSLRGPAAA